MEIQSTIFGSCEVTILYKPTGGEIENRSIFEGSLEECNEYIATCQVNKASDSSREGDL